VCVCVCVCVCVLNNGQELGEIKQEFSALCSTYLVLPSEGDPDLHSIAPINSATVHHSCSPSHFGTDLKKFGLSMFCEIGVVIDKMWS
jgi:hypothetical protein